MIKIITLKDHEEGCSLLVSIDTEHTGVLMYGTNQYGDKVSMLFDVRLVKQLVNETSKAIKARPAGRNECGEVYASTLA